MTHHTTDTVPTRRTFLAALGAAGALALAGCTANGERHLDWIGEEADRDGRERHQLFGPDHDVILTVQQGSPLVEGVQVPVVPMSVLVHHREGLVTERLRLRLRAPPRDGSGFGAAILVRPPDEGWPGMTVSTDADRWTVIDLDGLGDPGPTGSVRGDSNVTVEFGLAPLGRHPVDDLFVGVDATVSESVVSGRRHYRIRHRSDFPLVRG